MRIFSYILSVIVTVVVLVTVTDVQTGIRGLLTESNNGPQHRSVSIAPEEEKSFLDRSLDSLAATFGLKREKPKSQLQQLMDRRRKEIAQEKSDFRFP